MDRGEAIFITSTFFAGKVIESEHVVETAFKFHKKNRIHTRFVQGTE